VLSRNPGLPDSPPLTPAVDRVGIRLHGDVSDRHFDLSLRRNHGKPDLSLKTIAEVGDYTGQNRV